jgi:uncharacterized protein (DUF2132 family)
MAKTKVDPLLVMLRSKKRLSLEEQRTLIRRCRRLEAMNQRERNCIDRLRERLDENQRHYWNKREELAACLPRCQHIEHGYYQQPTMATVVDTKDQYWCDDHAPTVFQTLRWADAMRGL